MKTRVYSTVICLFLSILLFSQNNNRIEFLDDDIQYHKCVPFAENGMLLKSFNPEINKSRKLITYTYEKYDTNLVKLPISANISIPAKKSAYIDYTTKKHHYNFAYQTNGTYCVSMISIDGLQTKTIFGKFPKHTIISTFRAVGNYLYFLGYTKDLPILVIQNIDTKEITFGKIIPLNRHKFSIVSFEVSEDNDEVYLFTKDVLRDDNLIKFYVYHHGKKVSETMIKSTDPDKYLETAFASKLKDGKYLIIGSYNNVKKNSNTSVGLFIMKQHETGKIESTKYINYLDINNFTSYLSIKAQERIEKKQEKKNAQNKELELNYLIAPHKIIEQDGEYVLVGEVYYPTYRQECQYISTGIGQTMYCYQVFDGFQYTHFFVMGFNDNGDIIWSNSEPMDIDDKPYSIVHYLSVNQNPPYLQTLYSTWNTIYSFNFKNGIEISKNEKKLVNDDEKLLSSTNKNRYWYNNTFLAYGVQKIKNKEDKAKREIFFIEKIQIPTK